MKVKTIKKLARIMAASILNITVEDLQKDDLNHEVQQFLPDSGDRELLAEQISKIANGIMLDVGTGEFKDWVKMALESE